MTTIRIDNLDIPVWQHLAECLTTDPSVFFSRKHDEKKIAFETCGRCEVRERCLKWTLDYESTTGMVPQGIYGGVEATKRRSMKVCIYGDCVKSREGPHKYFCGPEHQLLHKKANLKKHHQKERNSAPSEYYMRGRSTQLYY